MRLALLTVAALLGCVSCITTRAYRMPDNSIVIRERGILGDLTRTDTVIRGGVPGAINPASRLTIFERSSIKAVPFRSPPAEGYVDWTKPEQVEVRVVLKEPPHPYKLAVNGYHRLTTSHQSHRNAAVTSR